MQEQHMTERVLLNPYRENKRFFVNYIRNGSNLNLSLSKNATQHHEGFLDNISKVQSFKYKDESVDNRIINQSQADTSQKNSQFIVSNKRDINQFQNPQIFQLLSKHMVGKQSLVRKPNKNLIKPLHSLLSERIKAKSNSVQELQKTPKITEFWRQTFYRNTRQTSLQFSSKKQTQDILHSKINLNINTKKGLICKKTRPYKEDYSVVTIQLYKLDKRVGVDVEIISGRLKQIKFRLIMNQADTRTFLNGWSHKVDKFIDKCLVINEDGISLRLGSFNVYNKSKKKLSLIKCAHKIYLEQYENIKRRKSDQKKIQNIGNLGLSLENQEKKACFVEKNDNTAQNLLSQCLKQTPKDNELIAIQLDQKQSDQISAPKQHLKNHSIDQVDLKNQILNVPLSNNQQLS